MYKLPGIVLLLLVGTACSFFKPEAKTEAIARVNEHYLYPSDIKGLVPTGATKKDSLTIVHDFIARWASQELLYNAAEVNLNKAKKVNFDALINQYKIDMYNKAYLEEIVKQSVDTVISTTELKEYYAANKENFRTTATLVRLRYVHVNKDNPRFGSMQSKFFDFKKKDKKFWDTYAMQCKSYALNDTVWVSMDQVYNKLPFITTDNKDQYIAAGKKILYPDGNDIYLVKITNVIAKNQIGPFDYLIPTLRDVILNNRKLELIKKFEKDITDDALKDEKYELYKK
jgi:hypothetical protein